MNLLSLLFSIIIPKKLYPDFHKLKLWLKRIYLNINLKNAESHNFQVNYLVKSNSLKIL